MTTIVLYYLIGKLCFLALLILILLLFIQRRFFAQYLKIDTTRRTHLDSRSLLTSEFIYETKNIKFNALEKVLEEKIGKIRKKEQGLLRRLFKIFCVNLAYTWTMAPVTAFFIFLILNHRGVSLSIGSLFATQMYLNKLSFNLGYLLEAFTVYYSSVPSIQRLNKFMKLKEVRLNEANHRDKGSLGKRVPHSSIEFEDYSGTWEDFEVFEEVKGLNFIENKEGQKNGG